MKRRDTSARGRPLDSLRLVGIAGTNKVMAGELSRIARRLPGGARLPAATKAGPGALVYDFDGGLDHRVAAAAARYHRTASRVLWDLYESRARRLEPLYDGIAEAVASDRRGWSWQGASISVRARNLAAFAAGERQVVGAVKNALIDGAAARGVTLRVDPEHPDIHIAVRMHDDAVSVSVDLAGGPMHRRGYRRGRVEAPLRENLAAVLLMLARYDVRADALVDPMAGSGTIAIEAALMGQGAPVWAPPREPAFRRLPAFRDVPVGAEPLFADAEPVIVANDIHTPVVAAARESIAAAGVGERVISLHGDFRALDRRRIDRALAGRPRRERGLILSNPPYGHRVGGSAEEVAALYRELGRWCRQFRGWRAGFLVANPHFADAFGGKPRVVKPMTNGAMPARFVLYEL